MRIPETPPNWMAWLRGDDQESSAALQLIVQLQVEEFVRHANERYLHWDKLRFQSLPEGVTPELAWAAVQLSRRPQQQSLPLSFDGKGKLKYWLPPQQQQWVSIIDQQAGGYLGAPAAQPIPEDNERYLVNSLMEEAIASSQLEGACTTREVGKELLRSGRQPRDRDERMILNNYKAIREIRDLKKDNLTPALLCHLQRVLTDGTLDKPDAAGRFRRPDEQVCVADAITHEVIYTPPPADAIEDRVREACAFANEMSSTFVHPVVKAMALHFAIGFIHPFVDGNGRTARSLFYWYMLKNGYWLFEYLPISRIIVAARAKYARAYLFTETDAGDLTYFNQYHLKVVHRAISDLHRYLEFQRNRLAEAEQLLADFPELNYRQRDLLSNALKHSGAHYTASTQQGKYRVSYNTAYSDLSALVELGLFTKAKRPGGGKGWVFRPAPDLMKRLRRPTPRRGKRKQSGEAPRPKAGGVRRARKKKGEDEQRGLFDHQ
jgi:Fic family protein